MTAIVRADVALMSQFADLAIRGLKRIPDHVVSATDLEKPEVITATASIVADIHEIKLLIARIERNLAIIKSNTEYNRDAAWEDA